MLRTILHSALLGGIALLLAFCGGGGGGNSAAVMYFSAQSDTTTGYQLWKTDGTASGTVAVKTLNASGASNPSNFILFNGATYFTASGQGGRQLWRTDGSSAGTIPLTSGKDLAVFSSTQFNGALYLVGSKFVMHEPFAQIWKTDGTAEGTSEWVNGFSLAVFNGALYFCGSDTKLWKTSGTAGDPPVAVTSSSGISCGHLAVLNGALYGISAGASSGFPLPNGAPSGVAPIQLWKSDGTASGTAIVADVTSPGSVGIVTGVIEFGSELVFGVRYDYYASTGELWKTDGTAAGTTVLAANSSFFLPVKFNGALYFSASDVTHGSQLWKSDGTVAGTAPVTDGSPIAPLALIVSNGVLYFMNYVAATGNYQLWKSDGTAAGTTPVTDVSVIIDTPFSLTAFNGALYFAASDGVHGRELWTSDGTAANTRILTDLCSGACDGL